MSMAAADTSSMTCAQLLRLNMASLRKSSSHIRSYEKECLQLLGLTQNLRKQVQELESRAEYSEVLHELKITLESTVSFVRANGSLSPICEFVQYICVRNSFSDLRDDLLSWIENLTLDKRTNLSVDECGLWTEVKDWISVVKQRRLLEKQIEESVRSRRSGEMSRPHSLCVYEEKHKADLLRQLLEKEAQALCRLTGEGCYKCAKPFSLLNWRHACEHCHEIFCADCTLPARMEHKRNGGTGSDKVCVACSTMTASGRPLMKVELDGSGSLTSDSLQSCSHDTSSMDTSTDAGFSSYVIHEVPFNNRPINSF